MTRLPAPLSGASRTLARRLLRPLFHTRVYDLTLFRRTPKSLRLTPPDPWPGDPGRAEGILGGRFDLGFDRTVASVDPWALEPESTVFAAALHEFSWLGDLAQLDDKEAARRRARTIIEDWLARHSRWTPLAWRADVTGRRIVAWLTHYDGLLAPSGEIFRRVVLRSLARQWVHLRRVARLETDGARRIAAIKGWIYGAACMPDGNSELNQALAALREQLDAQIHEDGGHVARSPIVQQTVLRDLIDIRATLHDGQFDAPEALTNSIDRMAAMLRLYRHKDGGFAAFNGSGEGDVSEIEATLAGSGIRGVSPKSAPQTNFERLSHGRLLVITDTGSPAPPRFDDGAHAGTFSFEMSVERNRMIVNCGGAAADHESWREVQRATAAHSTLSVADTNSSEVVEGGGIGRRPVTLRHRREDNDDATKVIMVHDGYRPAFGLVHRRRLLLSQKAERLEGEDRLKGPAGQVFSIRFHLHPNITASIVQAGSAALLKLPRGEGGRFDISGGELRLADSIYLGGGTPKRTRQIVIDATTEEMDTVVRWNFHPESDDSG